MKIIFDVGEGATLNPPQIGFYRSDCAPPLLLSPVEEDGYPLAAPECLLQGMVHLRVIPPHDQQAPCRRIR